MFKNHFHLFCEFKFVNFSMQHHLYYMLGFHTEMGLFLNLYSTPLVYLCYHHTVLTLGFSILLISTLVQVAGIPKTEGWEYPEGRLVLNDKLFIVHSASSCSENLLSPSTEVHETSR